MKKVIKATLLGASVLALASTASAATMNINIFGASAQNKFWNDYAATFLTDSSGAGMGCVSATKAKVDKKKGITVGLGCTENGGDPVIIRYTADKSVEGPRAVMNLDPQGVGCDAANPGNRTQADWTDSNANGAVDFTVDADGYVDSGEISAQCLPVNVGASDVSSEAFTQESHGYENGMYDTTQFDENLAGQDIPGSAEIDMTAQPIVVPFSFFANTTLEVDHINRQQALLLFSGNVHNWSQFGADYPNKKVVLCLRHAGSGTHATLDKAIMRGDRSLPTQQAINVPPFIPSAGIMFHTSSSDLSECVHDNGGYATASAGAIGYADSDKIIDSVDATGVETVKSGYANVKRLAYNGGGEGMTAANFSTYGYSALKNEIANGSYEFWAAQWLYMDSNQNDDATEATFTKMVTFAADAANMPCDPANGDERGCYWLAGDELNVSKTDDNTVPFF